jgi:uncharacterized phage protein gp47/JayE
MPYGLTSSGFITKRLADSQAELESLYRSTFGAGIKTTPDTVFGKMIGIQAEREAEIWEVAEATYNNFYPNSASDISLDRACEITGTVRNAATHSTVTEYLAGTNLTAIPALTIFSVADSEVQFETLAAAVLSGSNFAITSVTRSGTTVTVTTPVAHGRADQSFVFMNDAVETDYNGLKQITVTGASTYTYEIATTPATPATGTITADPATAVDCQSVDAGSFEALANTLTNIVTNVSGLDRVENYIDAVEGSDTETDAELRIRRINALIGIAAARIDGIRGYLLAVPNVTAASVYENTTLVVDGDGRPGKSIECLVVGGTDQDIFDAVWNRKAGGIEAFGSESGTTTDSEGNSQDSYFSRPTGVDIWLELDVAVDATYPSDGDDLVEAAILDYEATLEIGEDVVVYPYLVSSIAGITGITDVVVRIGLSASPTLDNNIPIDQTEIADFDSSRIIVAQV